MAPEEVSSYPELQTLKYYGTTRPNAPWRIVHSAPFRNSVLQGPLLNRLLYAREIGQISNITQRINFVKPIGTMLVKEKKKKEEDEIVNNVERIEYPYARSTFLGISDDARFLFSVQWVRNKRYLERHGLENMSIDFLNSTGSPRVRIREITVFEITPECVEPVFSFPILSTLDRAYGQQSVLTNVKVAITDPHRCIFFNAPTEESFPRILQTTGARDHQLMWCSLSYFDLVQRIMIRCVFPFSMSRVKWLNYDDSVQKQFFVTAGGFAVNRHHCISALTLIVRPTEPIPFEQYQNMNAVRVLKFTGIQWVERPRHQRSFPDFSHHSLNSVRVYDIDKKINTLIPEVYVSELANPDPTAIYVLETCLDIRKCVHYFALEQVPLLIPGSTFTGLIGEHDTNILTIMDTGITMFISAVIMISHPLLGMTNCIITLDILWRREGRVTLGGSWLHILADQKESGLQSLAAATEYWRKNAAEQIIYDSKSEFGPADCFPGLHGMFDAYAFWLML